MPVWNTVQSMDGAESKGSTESASVDESRSAGGSDDYSTTNVQVQGVDEADVVKTDGEYIPGKQ